MSEPVALFGWALLALSIACARPLGLGWRWLACAGLTASYFFCCSPGGANFLVRQLEQNASAAAQRCGAPPKDSIFIVLGGGVAGSPRDARDFARLKESSLRRLIGAVDLARRAPDSVLLLSGGGVDGGVSQGELMASMAQALGIPPERLIVEPRAATTFEEARDIRHLLAENDPRPKYLVTSALHMPRALATFLASGLNVCALPVDFRYVEVEWYETLVPRLTALAKTDEAVHELVGYAFYALTGKITW